MKTFKELINEGSVNESKYGDMPELTNLDKVKKAFISDFKQGKLKDFEVKISDESGKVYDVKLDVLSDLETMFGDNRMLGWNEKYSLLKGDVLVISKDLDEALRYTFTNGKMSSFINTLELSNKLLDLFKKLRYVYTYESIKYGNIEMVKGK